MSYGLNVYKADGSLGFSTADITWQTVAQFTVAANATVANTYSEIAGMTVIAQRQLVNVPPNAQEDYNYSLTSIRIVVFTMYNTCVSTRHVGVNYGLWI